MGKNNYVVACEKRIQELKNTVAIDSAYIGSGFVIVLDRIGYDQDEIEQIMAQVNATWQEIRDKNVNPMEYCKELTGIEVLVADHEKEIIRKHFEGR